MADDIIQSNNLDATFKALKNKNIIIPESRQAIIRNQNYAPITSVNTGSWGTGNNRVITASNSGIIYGQPQFFSPVHTPINWQIPSKRKEISQWMFLPNTQVLTPDFTYINIEDLPFDCKDIIEDSITNGFIFEMNNPPNILNSEGIFNQPLRISMRDCENKRCFNISTIGNYKSISVSEEHGLYILDGELYRENYDCSNQKLIKKIEAKDVKKDDFLLTPIPKVGDSTLDKDMAWLIGFCVADGCIYHGEGSYYGVRFTGRKDEKALMRCKSILEANFKGTVSSGQHGTGLGWRVSVTTKEAYSFFRKYIVNKSINKKFSSEIFNFDKETRLNILAGYFDGDGCFSKKEKKLVSSSYSKNLANQIYWLLLSCGIVCSISKVKLSGTHYPTSSTCTYMVYVPSSKVNSLVPYMRGDKVPPSFVPKKERQLKFLYVNGEDTYLAQPINKIEEFLYTGKGFDIEMPNDKKALTANGYVCSNCRFFYTSEPKVASAIDFYSYFPINDYEHECKDRSVKKYFDKLKKRLDLNRWLRLMSHEIHLLGDCFPFVEIQCDQCNGIGKTGDEICNHEGGTIRRMVILNPDFVEVYTTPISPEPLLALLPDEELINMVQRKTPGFEKLSPDVIKLISAGQPIRLDNRNVSHLKYGEGGYDKFGTGMVRRLFPILAYKTKLMVAQWLVAERLIIPIKVVKVGSDERPAGPADIAAVQQQLAQTANDPNLTLVTHHAFEIDWVGSAGKVLTLSNEFEFINQEILDGLMINNALLNGEGPTFANAAVGIEAMIERLQSFRKELSTWVEEKIYLPEAMRQGFFEKDKDTGENEYIYPKIKWNPMHLRDQQQDKQFALQLYEKGLLSAQTLLEVFGYNPDMEIERKRFDAVQMAALGGTGGMGGGEAGGGMGGLGGMGGGFGGGGPTAPGGELGGGMAAPTPGGELGGMGGAPIAAGGVGGAAGGAPAAAPAMASSLNTISSNLQPADPSQFGGKILKEKTREKLLREKEKVYNKQNKAVQAIKEQGGILGTGVRDEKGRIIYTKPEMELIKSMVQYRNNNIIKYPIVSQFEIKYGSQIYLTDFAIVSLKIAIEADGEAFHSSEKQLQHDKERDMKLAQIGWTVLRFKDSEIENNVEAVMQTIIKTIMQKELVIQNQAKKLKEDHQEIQQNTTQTQL